MPSGALDNDPTGRQRSVLPVRDAFRRSTISQRYLPSHHPLEHLKSAEWSLSARNHSLSLFPILHTIIDRGSHTQSELVFAMTTLAGGGICTHRSTRSASATSCPLGYGRGSWMADSCAWNPAPPLSFLWILHPYLCKLWRLKTDILLTLETYSAARVTFGVMEVQTLIAIRLVAVDGADSQPTIHFIKVIFQTEEEPPLRAIIDYRLDANIISQGCRRILSRFPLHSLPLQPGRQITDSNGNMYTVTEQVELVVSKSGAADTEQDWFFVSNEQNLERSGSYDVILGRKWKDKFENKGLNGYRAAPTIYRDRDSKDERTRQEEEQNRREMIARGQQGEEEMRRANQQRNARERERILQGSR
ncbi:hypothetical protein IFM61606_06494 [Aspergillus udagawae]|uniref:Uncharacterized protein n=1 Tax=Aspergillus udagawae TaxID=91492 RepID=A0ABQ1B7B6_9EURO|nr:hypothetical protein IFM51744_10442 [Aspergillus udagawae]GFF95255.1 hypothetical protein IFM53868_07930 [Aspergillus udagawae]GFG26509.1 hypothetical protein IFM61606_06494 [Aspergillus udagawae]